MRKRIVATATLVGILMCGTASVRAEENDLPRNPGAAFAAAGINLVYMPVRLALSTVWAGVSGITGWLTGGNAVAADDVWQLTEGPAYVTPDMLARRERFRFGSWESGH
ncbi:MAG TPA: hypothetical protein VMW17_08855 [Candidatus Binatia bacterium]|nr:hypothetical protein [Candidatus Binatia bacterium]